MHCALLSMFTNLNYSVMCFVMLMLHNNLVFSKIGKTWTMLYCFYVTWFRIYWCCLCASRACFKVTTILPGVGIIILRYDMIRSFFILGYLVVEEVVSLCWKKIPVGFEPLESFSIYLAESICRIDMNLWFGHNYGHLDGVFQWMNNSPWHIRMQMTIFIYPNSIGLWTNTS